MKNFILYFSFLVTVFESKVSLAQGVGSLRVVGEPGKFQIFQKVKAVRCRQDMRGACDSPVFFDLNVAQSLPSGSYLVGFENSLYPDLVNVQAGRTVDLSLVKLSVPPNLQGNRIRVYRDFSRVIEQKKIYLEMYWMNRHFFRLDASNFGDFYLAGAWEREVVQRFTYEACPKINLYGEVSDSAKVVCKAWNSAKNPFDLRELYNFAGDGTFTEMWVTYPGDVIPSKHNRYLVSAPMTTQDFVSVFPGAYKFQAEGKNTNAISVMTSDLSQDATSSGFSLNARQTLFTVSGEECSSARMWKTDIRAFCTSDKQEGCDRSSAQACHAM